MTSAAPSSGSLERMLARRWNQQRIRTEQGKTASMALISPGAPSEVTAVGDRSPRATMWRKNSVQHASDSLLPTARCNRCFFPSASMHQATSRASLAPWARSDSKIASKNRYSTAIPERFRVQKAW
jgi:hypothetical protein